MRSKTPILLLSFGAPRSLEEVESFFVEMLTDEQMVSTPLPSWLHRPLFTLIAKLRAPGYRKRLQTIGGASPIVEETERLAQALDPPVIPFYRYLPITHAFFIKRVEALQDVDAIPVLPLYPQYSNATTGSCMVWLQRHLSAAVFEKLRLIDSYAAHPAFLKAWIEALLAFLKQAKLREGEVTLLFSAHGLPQKAVLQGDPYQEQVIASFQGVARAFPSVHKILAYQSKFGWGKWLEPATDQVCAKAFLKEHVVFVPIAFTMDHIETLYEIEHDYFPLLSERGITPHRCPVPFLGPALAEVLISPTKKWL